MNPPRSSDSRSSPLLHFLLGTLTSGSLMVLYQYLQKRSQDRSELEGFEYEGRVSGDHELEESKASHLSSAAGKDGGDLQTLQSPKASDLVLHQLSDGSKMRLAYCRGELFPPFISEESLQLLSETVLPEGSCFIATYPKSGTTLTQRVAQILLGREDEKLTTATPWLLEALGPRSLPEHRIDPAESRVFKSHTSWPNVKKQPGLKYIYVARNGRDVAVSFYHHTTAFDVYGFDGSWDAYLKDIFLTGRGESGCWFTHVKQWWEASQRWPETILFLCFEDFKSDPETFIRKIARWLGVEADDALIQKTVNMTAFEVMKNDPKANYSWTESRRAADQPRFMRKGKVGDWKNYFTEEQDQLFSARFQEILGDTELASMFRFESDDDNVDL